MARGCQWLRWILLNLGEAANLWMLQVLRHLKSCSAFKLIYKDPDVQVF